MESPQKTQKSERVEWTIEPDEDYLSYLIFYGGMAVSGFIILGIFVTIVFLPENLVYYRTCQNLKFIWETVKINCVFLDSVGVDLGRRYVIVFYFNFIFVSVFNMLLLAYFIFSRAPLRPATKKQYKSLFTGGMSIIVLIYLLFFIEFAPQAGVISFWQKLFSTEFALLVVAILFYAMSVLLSNMAVILVKFVRF